jgi:gliding-associated putative ABC transporter substrate-binding component GldG
MSQTSDKKIKSRTNAVLYTMLVLFSLVAVNLIATRLFGRADLTEDHIYTLSKPSKDLVRNLPDRVIAKAFISKDLPPQVAQISKYMRDLLDEYKANSNGKFTWEAIDPTGDSKKEEEAQRLGVRKLQLQQLSREKVSIGSIYIGIAFEYGDKTEKLPQVGQMEGLEYEVSSILKRLTVKKRKIGFVAGQGELSQQQGLQAVWGALGQDYDVATVNLGTSPQPIADDIDALVVMGPKQPYSDPAKKAIDDFLMKGKAVAFFVDGMTMEQPRGQMPPEMGGQMPRIARKNDVALDSLLGSYGFKVEDDIVMDEQNARAPALVNGQVYLINQPYFPIANQLAKHDTTDKLRAILFPLASSVQLVGPMKEAEGKKGAAELVALARSTDRSWKQTGFFLMDPTHEIKPADTRESLVFGYAYKGPLKSAYAPAAPPAAVSSSDPQPSGESKGAVRLVVVGDSDFASDDFMRAREIAMQNGHFFLNIVDWLVQDETLTPVRGKGVTQRPLAVKSENTPTMVKTANIIGLPVLFIGYGVMRWRRRAAKRAHFQL